MSDAHAEEISWTRSPWIKWSWLLVLVVIIAQSLDYHWRVLPTSAAGYFARGKADFLNGEFASAAANLSKSIELRPMAAESYFWRGETYLRLHDLVRAMPDFEKAVDLQPEHEKPHAAYGDGKDAAWDAVGAIGEYSRALAIEPNYSKCYLARGMLLYDGKRWGDAAADLGRAASMFLDGRQVTANVLLWVARARAGDAAGASAALSGVVKAGRIRGDRFGTTARFLCGELAEPGFLAAMAAINDADDDELKAEGFFLAGARRLVFGDRAGAAGLMRKALETGADTSYAFDRARVELETLLLGFHPMRIDEPRRMRLSLPPDTGLVVASVAAGGPAEAAGIGPGAVVATIDGAAAGRRSYVEFLSKTAPGSTAVLELIDGAGAHAKVPLTLRLDFSAPTR